MSFLSKKEFDGKLRQDDGLLVAVGTLVTLTASAGKDMYLAKAKVNWETVGVGDLTIELDVNGVVIETYEVTFVASDVGHYEYLSSGFKVLATQIIKLEVTSEVNGRVHGTLICFEEDTGTNPSVT